MSESKCKRVFILGAGCSANYGYPLGLKLVDELQAFKIPIECPCIRDAVSKTIETASKMASRFQQVDTLDKLVNICEEDFNTFSRQRAKWDNADTEHENLTFDQILNAKIATAAFFLHKESVARQTTLQGYKERLLPDVFGRDKCWGHAVGGSDCSVLTFNYDRLFEIAFLDYFRNSNGFPEIAQYTLYGKSVLNSGFDSTAPRGKMVEISPDRFCFLKLHGSVGWWAKTCATNDHTKDCRDYYALSPDTPTDLLQLEHCLRGNKRQNKWEPLVVFPHEKQRFTPVHRGAFEQGPYVAKVWEHAAEVLRKATAVTVIGYSFSEIDRTHMVENLLCKTPTTAKIRIENKGETGVKAVRDALKIENNPDLQDRLNRGRLEFIAREF